MDVESIPFNRGFYSVDMTFFFSVCLNAYASPIAPPTPVNGFATFSKKVILYGSEGNVKVFSSDDRFSADSCPDLRNRLGNTPKATVQVVSPIVLSTRLLECPGTCCTCPCAPQGVTSLFDGNFEAVTQPEKVVLITLGLFTIVQMERSVQMMIPAYDFCVPDKECACSADDPCELFKRIKFPTNEFFPPKLSDAEGVSSEDRTCSG